MSVKKVLFNDTVAANIAYGANVSLEEIKQAAISAHAMEFIAQLPNELHTQIGENGSSLSGGQRQRIALARALLKKSQIIILDEATSALDATSENEISAAIQDLHGKATIIIVAHKLNSIKLSDQIYVLSAGELIEYGRHDSLIEMKGEYFKSFNANQ